MDVKITLTLFKNPNQIVKVTLKDVIVTILLLTTCETFQTSQMDQLSIDVIKPF